MTSTSNLLQFKPTYLYIKQHSVTGKLYFGKTVQNVLEYTGSGKHWLRHIKKHGVEHVITLWYELFTDKDSLTAFALQFSKEMNIVESTSWLNLVDENGIDGVILGFKHSDETKAKMSNAQLGISKSDTHRKNISLSRKGKQMKKHTSEHISNMKAALKGIKKTIIVCPHCNQEGGSNSMKRWHFDNCIHQYPSDSNEYKMLQMKRTNNTNQMNFRV